MTDTQEDRIEGKVAQVLTNRELVINRGEADGVQVGMRFAVLNRRGLDIKDPDTGEPLGSAELAKTVVKVVRIEAPHLSVARTFRMTPGSPGIAALAAFAGSPARVETFSIEGEGAARKEVNPKDLFVTVGDRVVQTIGDEFDDQ